MQRKTFVQNVWMQEFCSTIGDAMQDFCLNICGGRLVVKQDGCNAKLCLELLGFDHIFCAQDKTLVKHFCAKQDFFVQKG